MNDFLDNLGAEQYRKIVKKILEKQQQEKEQDGKESRSAN